HPSAAWRCNRREEEHESHRQHAGQRHRRPRVHPSRPSLAVRRRRRRLPSIHPPSFLACHSANIGCSTSRGGLPFPPTAANGNVRHFMSLAFFFLFPLPLPPRSVHLLLLPGELRIFLDRKTTRLNSSHVSSSYAV